MKNKDNTRNYNVLECINSCLQISQSSVFKWQGAFPKDDKY